MANNNHASYEHNAKYNISRLIEAEALQLGMDAFFRKHVRTWADPKHYKNPRNFAKEVTFNLPDYCSFDAFYAKFQDRFQAWHETGNIDGIADDPGEE